MPKIDFLIVSVLVLITSYRLFVGLGDQPLERWDEKTNISVVTDSVSQNMFPVLYLGPKPFFEKPPLWYFANSLVAKTFGTSAVSMRMTSAFSGLFVILISAYLAWRWWGKTAMIVTWLVLLSTDQLFITNAGGYFATHTLRSADVDALQLLFLLIAFVLAVEIKKHRFAPLLLGVFSGLAVLTKGPIGLLPIMFIPVSPISYLSLLLVVLPWYIFMVIKFGHGFLAANLGYHLTERVLVPLEGHRESIWFYLGILTSKSMFISWPLLFISLFWAIIRKKYHDRRILFLVLMVSFCFIIPSLVQTKLAWYILPIYPFAALLIGAFFADNQRLIGKCTNYITSTL